MFYPFPGDAANLQMNDSVDRIVIRKRGILIQDVSLFFSGFTNH